MTEYNMYRLFRKVCGEVQPEAEAAIDAKRKANMDEWADMFYSIAYELMRCAETNLRQYSSAKEVSNSAREILKEVYDLIADSMKSWEDEVKS